MKAEIAKCKPSNVHPFPQAIGDPARANAARAAHRAAEKDFDRQVVDELWERHRELIAIELDARAKSEAVIYLLRLPRAERIKMTACHHRQWVPRSA